MRDDEVIEPRPESTIPADQRWFWSERWQRMEREADADVAAGRVTRSDTPEAFLDELNELQGNNVVRNYS